MRSGMNSALLLETEYHRLRSPGDDPEDLANVLEQFYELEYKHMMLTRGKPHFGGVPRRYDNIMKRLRGLLLEHIQDAASILHPIYDWWVQLHDPNIDRWTQARYDDLCYRHGEAYEVIRDGIIPVAIEWEDVHKIIPHWCELAYREDRQQFEEDKEYRLQYLDPDDEDDADEIAEIEAEEYPYDDVEDYVTGVLPDIYDSPIGLLEYLERHGHADPDWDAMLMSSLREWGEEQWMPRWRNSQAYQTVKRATAVLALLTKAKDPTKDSGRLNWTLTVAHNNGSMLDYVAEEADYRVDEDFLRRLSNADTKEWDRDLEKLGLDVKAVLGGKRGTTLAKRREKR